MIDLCSQELGYLRYGCLSLQDALKNTFSIHASFMYDRDKLTD